MEKVFRNGFDEPGDSAKRKAFLKVIQKSLNQGRKDYLAVIKGLNEKERDLGTAWLQGLLDGICEKAWSSVPGFGI